MMDIHTRQTLSLNGRWSVRLDEQNRGTAAGWYLAAVEEEYACPVPGPLQAVKALHDRFPIANTMQNAYKGNYWLEQTVPLPERAPDSRLLLYIGGVSPTAHIWVNGRYAGFLDEPHVAHTLDITEPIAAAESARVTVLISEQQTETLGGFRSFGFDWSGIYRDIALEIVPPLYAQELSIDNTVNPRTSDNRAGVSLSVRNAGTQPADALVEFIVSDGEKGLFKTTARAPIAAGDTGVLEGFLDTAALTPWTPDNPAVYTVSAVLYRDGKPVDAVQKITGFRTFTAEHGQLLLNGEPLMLRGVGHEYFSVSISPLIDKALIRRRFQCIKAHGFNFCRYHTHPPTEEELCVADEVGILLSSEIALISNMSKVSPAKKCLTILEKQILATKHHPSMGIYCLGNEGSQIMVANYLEREKALAGYQLIKKAAPHHLAIIAFGLQGELPELPNDMETPHLWSHDFLWAYDGLADIPWDVLDAALPADKPWVIHEFGKFGVWPDPEESRLYDGYGYQPDFAEQGALALKEIGLEAYARQIIENSRTLASICNRQIIEQARRPERSSGYVIWTFFRRGGQNAGMVDDFAVRPDKDPALYARGCNAPTALILDRSFAGRTLWAGQSVQLGVSVSNFGPRAITSGVVRWRIDGLDEELCGEIGGVQAPRGKSCPAAELAFRLPDAKRAARFTLEVSLTENDSLVSENAWDFWVFPRENARLTSRIAYDLQDTELRLRFKNTFLGSVGLREIDSVIRGCRSWSGTDYAQTFRRFAPRLLVTDRFGDTARVCLAHGQTVLLLDGGDWPAHWYTEPSVPHLGDEDTARFFTSFRCGWDQGNLATLIHPHPLLEGFPCADYCDLQFFAMTNGARTLRLEEVKRDVGGTDETVIIRSIAKIRPPAVTDVIVQDPNAVKELEKQKGRFICAQDRVFFAQMRVGEGTLLLSTLRAFDDPAGEYLLRSLLETFR